MLKSRNREILGIFLVALGLLFLLVNNGLLWFGWEAIWPLFPLIAGVFLLKVYASGKRPGQLFSGLVLSGIGAFLFTFSTGMLPWGEMRILWPFFPLILGVGLLALGATGERDGSALVVGLAAVMGAVVCFWAVRGSSGSRVLTPIIRLWPLVLIIAGALIYNRAKRERLDAVTVGAGTIETKPPPKPEN
jgi:hypothetical protein